MPYARLLYHAVWATKFRQPVIDEAVALLVAQAIEQTSRELDVVVYAVGTMPDHVHVFAQIPPALTVAKVIGRWKGASSHAANANRADALSVLAWQSGYGVLSVSQSGFDKVMAYVQNQQARHASREVYAAMEKSEDD
jgi:REP element-mobilizing transposase RayT